jgi:hypothetical protein
VDSTPKMSAKIAQIVLKNRQMTNMAFIYQMIAFENTVFYPKTVRFSISRLCLEIACQFRLSTELFWYCDLARSFKTEPLETVSFSFGITENTIGLFICSGSQLQSARRQGVFGYPKQSGTVSIGSVLKWRASPQCLRSTCRWTTHMFSNVLTVYHLVDERHNAGLPHF